MLLLTSEKIRKISLICLLVEQLRPTPSLVTSHLLDAGLPSASAGDSVLVPLSVNLITLNELLKLQASVSSPDGRASSEGSATAGAAAGASEPRVPPPPFPEIGRAHV